MENEVELKPKDNYGGSELCRSRRNHICTLLCDEKSDTHDEPFLKACPLCKTDKPELSRNEKLEPVIFCRKCSLELSSLDIHKLIATWNTRATPPSPLTAEEAKDRAREVAAPTIGKVKPYVYAELVNRIVSELMAVVTVPRDLRSRLVNLAANILKARTFDESDPMDEKLRLWAIEAREIYGATVATVPSPELAATSTETADEISIDNALAELRGLFPQGFCEIMFPTESGTEKNYLASVVIAVWDTTRSCGSLSHFDSPTLSEAMRAVRDHAFQSEPRKS